MACEFANKSPAALRPSAIEPVASSGMMPSPSKSIPKANSVATYPADVRACQPSLETKFHEASSRQKWSAPEECSQTIVLVPPMFSAARAVKPDAIIES